MRVMNVIRIVLLGGLIVAGVVLYPDHGRKTADPASVTSLAPDAVTVTILTAHPS